MRQFTTAVAIALGLSAAATAASAAAPVGPVSEISITVGSWLDQKRVDRVDERDLTYLKDELRQSVEAQLGKRGLLTPAGGGRLDLVLEDVTANRPTLQEMKYYPTLSFSSFSNGGAEITGTYTAPDGSRTPVSFERTEFDLRSAQYSSTWRDAARAFNAFAQALVEGKADEKLSSRGTRVYRPGRDTYAWR